GLADVEIGSLTIRMDYQSFDDYWEPLLGGQGPVGTFVQTLDARSLAKLRLAVQSAYLSGRPEGRDRSPLQPAPFSAKYVNPSSLASSTARRCYSYVAWTIAGMSDRTQLKCTNGLTIPSQDTRISGAGHDKL